MFCRHYEESLFYAQQSPAVARRLDASTAEACVLNAVGYVTGTTLEFGSFLGVRFETPLPFALLVLTIRSKA